MSHYSILHFIFEPDFNIGFLQESWICPLCLNWCQKFTDDTVSNKEDRNKTINWVCLCQWNWFDGNYPYSFNDLFPRVYCNCLGGGPACDGICYTLSEAINSLGCRRNSSGGSMLIRQLAELQLLTCSRNVNTWVFPAFNQPSNLNIDIKLTEMMLYSGMSYFFWECTICGRCSNSVTSLLSVLLLHCSGASDLLRRGDLPVLPVTDIYAISLPSASGCPGHMLSIQKQLVEKRLLSAVHRH